MERRKFLIGLGSTAAASTALVGSGAFSTTETDRSLTVNVAGDSDAYLKFRETLHNDNNDVYSEIGEDGKLRIEFGENSAGGKGVNKGSKTCFWDVFGIANQGTEDIEVWIEVDGNLENYLEFYPQHPDNHDSMMGEENAHSFNGHTGVGDSFEVGICVDLRPDEMEAAEIGELDGTITVHAQSVESRYH